MRQIARAMRKVNAGRKSQSLPAISSSINDGPTSVTRLAASLLDSDQNEHSRQSNLYDVPPETDIEVLIDDYFTNTGLLSPYLHEPTFRASYQEMIANNYTRVRKTWLALLNAVLATSVRSAVSLSKTPEQRTSEAAIYYYRALRLCGDGIYRGTSLEIGTVVKLSSERHNG